MPAQPAARHLKGYLITSTAGDRAWAADDEQHARDQHTMTFPDEPILNVVESAPWWVYITRDDSADLAVGPYATEAIAVDAMESSALVDSLCEEGAVDCYCNGEQPHEQDLTCDVVYINPADPHHFG